MNYGAEITQRSQRCRDTDHERKYTLLGPLRFHVRRPVEERLGGRATPQGVANE